jgi:hypothetical protein
VSIVGASREEKCRAEEEAVIASFDFRASLKLMMRDIRMDDGHPTERERK